MCFFFLWSIACAIFINDNRSARANRPRRQTLFLAFHFSFLQNDVSKMRSPTVCLRFYSNDKNGERIEIAKLKRKLAEILGDRNFDLKSEYCFYVIVDQQHAAELTGDSWDRLQWLLASDVFEPQLRKESQFESEDFVVEIGPRLTFTTPFSTNAVAACSTAINGIRRIERSQRFRVDHKNAKKVFEGRDLISIFGDRMTQCVYGQQPNFEVQTQRVDHFTVDLLGENGAKELGRINQEANRLCFHELTAFFQLGLAFDEADRSFYLEFFRRSGRNPTDVELFDLAQSNSEHSRHWFFKGDLIVDGKSRGESLFQTIQSTQTTSNRNNVIAFNDNSSGIEGFEIDCIKPVDSTCTSQLKVSPTLRHIIYTAETHNFPTGVCPFPGAATGTGGRIRDVHATGRGAHEIAGVVGYAVGNLRIPNYKLPWEDETFEYPPSFASPVDILIEGSNGASDYGNKFGEPVICGFTRTFGQRLKDNKRCEFVKPILFSGGIGQLDGEQVRKVGPKSGQLVAKIGGPVYRIGVGGGAASSVAVQGARDQHLDYGAVQRGDPEMEQKVHRFVRGCVELGEENPILSIHDQGAGGNGNVLKELVEGKNGGAVIESTAFQLGDPTISIRELWGTEYQENDAILLREDSQSVAAAMAIAERERCPLSIVGKVTGDERIVLIDFDGKQRPVDLNLNDLAEREPKKFELKVDKENGNVKPLSLPSDLSVRDALERVLRLPSVASKRFLTNKVDRSVTGLVAQQQCVGPLQTPLADVAVTALSYYNRKGAAMGVGEQPVKGLVDSKAGARMAVAEALTNLVFAPITEIQDVKCSGNWMWAAKLETEGANLVATCDSMCEFMSAVGIAVDGGKDSLSMAACCPPEAEIVRAPGTLVITAYAPCVDVDRVVTPNLKVGGDARHSDSRPTHLIHVSINHDKHRLGGSALAQCYNQIGDVSPDIDDPAYFRTVFSAVQHWVDFGWLRAGHDVSDGGLLVTVLEMAFAGNRGIKLNWNDDSADPLAIMFAEESGFVFELDESHVYLFEHYCQEHKIQFQLIGHALPIYGSKAKVQVQLNDKTLIDEPLNQLRELWEETSDQLERLQTSDRCVDEQIEWRKLVDLIHYRANFDFGRLITILPKADQPRVGILREEGSNGDREMAAAFMMVGFAVVDVTMSDLAAGRQPLIDFDGLVFVGGFSFADVLGAAKGWTSSVRFNQRVREEFEKFHDRANTFSLGVCNGCQLMTLLGWVGDLHRVAEEVCDIDSTEMSKYADEECTISMIENDCQRFHSGFTSVRIEQSTAVMLQGMEDSVLGVWSSHGEGKFAYREPDVLDKMEAAKLISLRYVDGNGEPTQRYPANPNGSAKAVAGVCSADGRHLAMMPHPDRIGFATAERFAHEGARVVLSSRSQHNVQTAIQKLVEDGIPQERLSGVVCHVGKAEDRKRLIEFVVQLHGHIDVLFHNAGINPAIGSILDVTEKQYDKLMETNIKAAFFLSKLVLPFIRPGGSIIFNGTIGSFKCLKGITTYGALKVALIMLTKSMALELRARKIRCNCVCPGLIRTEMGRIMWDPNHQLKEKVDNGVSAWLKRIGTPEDIGAAVAYLASTDASYVNGETLIVAGGADCRL
ncbi:Formylglycinamide ribonucleotide amidotransferase [Aphelenchoides besseyi]|nr:Formylglycinamide ribonucleotide amidotransferase [Aphelenchoides besseyi]